MENPTNIHQTIDIVMDWSQMDQFGHINNIEYFRTEIAIHGDRRLMPANERHWSVVNIRHNGQYSSNSIWKPWLVSQRPIFKSWITYEEQLPDPLYLQRTYWHPKINAHYFETQTAIRHFQGQGNFWFAGVHTHDVDCHESAIISSVKIAKKLAPDSARLKTLLHRPALEP